MRPIGTVRDRLKFQLERLLMRGPIYRLFVIAAFIALISFVAGVLVFVFTDGFETRNTAIWWAFLRLTDPGYLGDDQGTFLRLVSTVVTVAGYVFFMGSLVAIMTQWLNSTMARLEKGLTPIFRKNHVLILGWSLRTVEVVRDLLMSEGRVRRFLDRLGGGRLHIVILAEEVSAELVQELKERLGPLWSSRKVTLRSGSPLHVEHLRRVDFLRASAILLPGRDIIDEAEASGDWVALKTLLSTTAASRQLGAEQTPLMVAELSDARTISIARRAYGGPIELVASDLLIARLMTQSIRHPGMSAVFGELLSHRGHELYVRRLPELTGLEIGEVRRAFDRGIFLGIVREEEGRFVPYLDPSPDFALQPEDRLALLAPGYEHSRPKRDRITEGTRFAAREQQVRPTATHTRKLLLLGWNQSVPEIVRVLEESTEDRFSVVSVSLVPTELRETAMLRRDVTADRVEVRMLVADYTSISDVERLKPHEYDNIVLLSSDHHESEADSDARTLAGYLVLKQVLSGSIPSPRVLVELNDPENKLLIADEADEVLISPAVLSHVLTQVALRRELAVVYDELFRAGGAELKLQNAAHFGVFSDDATFEDVQEALWASGGIAIGVRRKNVKGGEVLLNPKRGEALRLSKEDEIVVLGTE